MIDGILSKAAQTPKLIEENNWIASVYLRLFI
jgi:hypothetical protein